MLERFVVGARMQTKLFIDAGVSEVERCLSDGLWMKPGGWKAVAHRSLLNLKENTIIRMSC